MIAAAAWALLVAAAPGCPGDPAAGLGPEAVAERAREVAASGAGPTRFLEDAARELADAPPADRPRLGARLGAALDHRCRLAEQPRSRARVGPGDRAELERILGQPRFARARLEQGLLARWLARAWAWIAELLGTEEAERYASGGRTAFFALVAAAALLLGARSLRRRRARASRRPEPQPVLEPPPPAGASLDAALAGGDPVGAVRAAFLLALASLERAGALPGGRALTNREMAGRLEEGAPAAAVDFARLARAFDRAVYGGERPGAEEVASCAAAARRLAAAGAGGGR